MQLKRVKLALHFVRLALPLGLILLAVGLSLSTRNLEAYNQSPYPLPPTLRFHQRITLPTEASGLIDQARIPVEFTLMRGETVADVFEKLGLGGVEARQATNALAERLNLRRLKAGNQYSAFFKPDSTLESFQLTLEGSGRVEMTRATSTGASGLEKAWQVAWQPFERTVRIGLEIARGQENAL